jgi:hypothetical protein
MIEVVLVALDIQDGLSQQGWDVGKVMDGCENMKQVLYKVARIIAKNRNNLVMSL